MAKPKVLTSKSTFSWTCNTRTPRIWGNETRWDDVCWIYSLPGWSMEGGKWRFRLGFRYTNKKLGGGNSNIFGCSPRNLGKIYSILTHIFQRGWNLETINYIESNHPWLVTGNPGAISRHIKHTGEIFPCMVIFDQTRFLWPKETNSLPLEKWRRNESWKSRYVGVFWCQTSQF